MPPRAIGQRPAPIPPCPCCGRTAPVQAVPFIVRGYGKPSATDRIQDGLDTSWTSNAIGMKHAKSDHIMRPRLVKDLMPPPRPRDARAQLDTHLTIMVNLAFLALLLFLAGRAFNAVEGTYLALALCAIIFLYAATLAAFAATGHLRRLIAARTAREEAALARWRTLYYCADCDRAFTPGWSGGIPTRQVRAYVAGRAVAPPPRTATPTATR